MTRGVARVRDQGRSWVRATVPVHRHAAMAGWAPMSQLYCFRCLTDDHEHVEAVTAFVGTPLCERCAQEEERLRRQMIQEAASNLRL
jgi:hypothetical protein